jgi:hypothetical protein
MDTSTHGPIDDLPDHLAFAWLDRASVTRTRATTRARYRSNGGTEYAVMVGGHRSSPAPAYAPGDHVFIPGDVLAVAAKEMDAMCEFCRGVRLDSRGDSEAGRRLLQQLLDSPGVLHPPHHRHHLSDEPIPETGRSVGG